MRKAEDGVENEEIENGVESEEISMTWDVLRNFFFAFLFSAVRVSALDRGG